MRDPRAVQPLLDARGPDVRFCHSRRHAEPAWHLHSMSFGALTCVGCCNRLLAALWVLQRPAPKVWTGVAAAPKPIRW
jgi:hypothetical protein